MAQNRIGGAGIGLPFPQSLYPVSLQGAATTPATSEVTLGAGMALPIPGGDWAINVGKYSLLQYLDPVSGVWLNLQAAPGTNYVHSDGQNIRIANLTGCPIGATVTTTGTAYTQAGTTVTANGTGGSLWKAIVGGALNTSVSVSSAGSGYTIAPLVLIPAPPSPGIPATASAVISGGSVTSISIINQGAGYTTIPALTILPSPYDTNAGLVVQATAVAAYASGQSGGAGGVTAVLCTNPGAPVTSAPTLTIACAGSSATAAATVNLLQTATLASVTAGGVGYSAATLVTSVGGWGAGGGVYTNPLFEQQILTPRAASMSVIVSGTSITSIANVYDGGMFAGAPTTLVLTNAVVTTAATLSLTLGSVSDTSFLQPL